MNTGFEFLKDLERDLTEIARQEKRRLTDTASPRRASHRRAWLGAAASFLAIAFAIGFLAQGGGFRSSSMSSAAGSFSTVGSAVGGTGQQDVPAAVPAVLQPDGAADVQFGLSQGLVKHGAIAAPADLSKIVRDGAIAVTIADGSFSDRFKQVVGITGSNGGTVLSSTTAGGDSGTFTLRIPAANFDKTMLQLRDLGTVDSSEIHGQDVTAEYVDAKAHVKIYLSRRKILYGLMAQATTIGSTLIVQNQLEAVQLKIDQITGQLRYLDNQVAESTIKVDIHEPGAAAATATDDIRNPSLGRAFDRAIQGFMNILAAMLIGFGYLIPLLVIAGGIYLGVAVVRRRSRRTTDGA
ncbi:MAG: DUF4349 domain-containing protein [Actinomycetota bacterium]